jgi:hypothetical protein
VASSLQSKSQHVTAIRLTLSAILCCAISGAAMPAQETTPPATPMTVSSAYPTVLDAAASLPHIPVTPSLTPKLFPVPMWAGQKPYLIRYHNDGTKFTPSDKLGSTYIPVDSWVYPAMLRLWSMGYVDTAFLSLRPWTRRSVLHMLDECEGDVRFDGRDEALELLDKLYYELRDEPRADGPTNRGMVYGMQSAYVGLRGVAGTVLRDSWHVGQTFNNDYGRPYSTGVNSYDGVSAISEAGPFSLYVRGEYQHAPSYEGYSFLLAQNISERLDGIPYGDTILPFVTHNRPQATIPEGPLPSQNNFRLLEANLSVHVLNHEISFGKSDAWLGPGLGGSMAWSNNAENMYTFRINRVEPLHIPYFSHVFGDLRYDFFIGSLKGHTYPRDPWAHSAIISLAPTKNFQFSFQRTVIFGGKNHTPVTLHTFIESFINTSDTSLAQKYGRNDPGARFSSTTFSYRLPFVRKYVSLYADSTTHDDVFPISAPRRAGWRPGLFFTQIPYVPKLDFRVEGVYTDYVTSRSTNGQGNYYETIQRQGYTNKGFLIGDWIGREAKGGQAWLTYHLSGNESIQVQYLRKKNSKDFIYSALDANNREINGGTTQDIFRVDLIKRLGRDVELNAWFQREQWKAPIWKQGQQGSTTAAFTLTWYPQLHTTAHF